MRARALALALLLSLLALAAAKKQVEESARRPLSPAEVAHRKNQRFFFSIGEGFEGTASDWTEYVVWLVGVTGVFFYMANPNARRNLHAVRDDDDDGGATPAYQTPGAAGDEVFGSETHSKND